MDKRVILLAAVVAFGFETELQAYTDPGSGALIWQMLVAGFVGSMFYVRRFTTWIKRKRQ